MNDTAITASRLGRRFGRRWALRDCSLDIPRGKVVGLVGPNGAGKSTLMSILVGLLSPTEGAASTLGRPVAPNTARPDVGYVDQGYSLYGGFTVREMVKAAKLLNTDWDEEFAAQRIVTLGVPLDRKVRRLSGGQRAQVALVLALAKRPDLLILDEPVARLDPLARKDLMRVLVEQQAERNGTVILSSHIVSELERLCDHLVVLNHGRVILDGDVDDLLEQHRMLIGPKSTVDSDLAGQNIVHREDDDDRTSVLVRNPEGPACEGWKVERVNLESLTVRYLSLREDSTHVSEEVAV